MLLTLWPKKNIHQSAQGDQSGSFSKNMNWTIVKAGASLVRKLLVIQCCVPDFQINDLLLYKSQWQY